MKILRFNYGKEDCNRYYLKQTKRNQNRYNSNSTRTYSREVQYNEHNHNPMAMGFHQVTKAITDLQAMLEKLKIY